MSGRDEKGHEPQVLIVGCGDLGIRLARLVIQADYTVTGVRRFPPENTCDGLVWHCADISQPLTADLPSCEHLVFCPAPSGRDLEAYRSVYVEGLKNTLAALPELPKSLWIISSTGVYGDLEGEVDEMTQPEPDSPFNQAIADMEALARNQNTSVCIIRLSGLYGPGRTYLVDKVCAGMLPNADAQVWTNRIYIDDAARCVMHLIQRAETGDAIDPIYIGVDDEPAQLNDVILWLRHYLQVEREDAELRWQRTGSKRLLNHKLKKTGFQFLYPNFREGYKALIDSEHLLKE